MPLYETWGNLRQHIVRVKLWKHAWTHCKHILQHVAKKQLFINREQGALFFHAGRWRRASSAAPRSGCLARLYLEPLWLLFNILKTNMTHYLLFASVCKNERPEKNTRLQSVRDVKLDGRALAAQSPVQICTCRTLRNILTCYILLYRLYPVVSGGGVTGNEALKPVTTVHVCVSALKARHNPNSLRQSVNFQTKHWGHLPCWWRTKQVF